MAKWAAQFTFAPDDVLDYLKKNRQSRTASDISVTSLRDRDKKKKLGCSILDQDDPAFTFFPSLFSSFSQAMLKGLSGHLEDKVLSVYPGSKRWMEASAGQLYGTETPADSLKRGASSRLR